MCVSEDQRAAFDARLAPELGSVVAARRLVQAATAAWGLPDRVTHDAALAVSELVTNAVLHAGTDVVVSIGPRGSGVRIEVRDGSDRIPAFERERPEDLVATRSMTGRGLAVVAALADRWGVDPAPRGGKVMWAEIGVHDGPGDRLRPGRPLERRPTDLARPGLRWRSDPPIELIGPPAGGPASGVDFAAPTLPSVVVAAAGAPWPERSLITPSGTPSGGRAVCLVGVPVHLLVESAGQLADLLREVQVITLDPAARVGSDDLAETARRLGRSLGPLSAHGFRSAELARARGDERADVRVDVADEAVGPYGELDLLLARLAESVSGLVLLTRPASDEVTAYRRWCGQEVVRQLAGAAPRACPFGLLPTD